MIIVNGEVVAKGENIEEWFLMRETGGLILRNDGGTAYNRAYLASCLWQSVRIVVGDRNLNDLDKILYYLCLPRIIDKSAREPLLQRAQVTYNLMRTADYDLNCVMRPASKWYIFQSATEEELEQGFVMEMLEQGLLSNLSSVRGC